MAMLPVPGDEATKGQLSKVAQTVSFESFST